MKLTNESKHFEIDRIYDLKHFRNVCDNHRTEGKPTSTHTLEFHNIHQQVIMKNEINYAGKYYLFINNNVQILLYKV